MRRTEKPLHAVLRGALAGLAGGLAIMLAMQTADQLIPTPPSPPEGPPPEEPREKLVRKVASGVFEVELPEGQRAAWAQSLHWMYSAFWGALYGIVEPSLHLPKILIGVLFGTVVWIVGPVIMLPTMKLAPSQQTLPKFMVVINWVFHLIFGGVTAYVHDLLSFDKNCSNR